jgi:class 3 adenylate cyclase
MIEARSSSSAGAVPTPDSISIVQRGNLKTLEESVHKQSRLGQNIVLCWSATDNGLLVLMVPHYFLGNYSAVADKDEAHSNEAFIQQLISGDRYRQRDEFFEVANRLGVAPSFIKLPVQLSEEPTVVAAVERVIKRYGISYVSSRAVLLFDIAEFSLYQPFEQASQLNSLSYSLNSAYNKLLTRGIEINFARTTTGDGYYVWNRDLSRQADQDLFHFLLLVIADNALAREASKGNTVPLIRSAYHIGSHYELYQAEGVNPTLFSYIVGDVTIELARMLDMALPGQVFIGDFTVDLPGKTGVVDTPGFLADCSEKLQKLHGIQLSGDAIAAMNCGPAGTAGEGGVIQPRRFMLTDKHGLSREAFSLQVDIRTDSGRSLQLGLSDAELAGEHLDLVVGGVGAPVTPDRNAVQALGNSTLKPLPED